MTRHTYRPGDAIDPGATYYPMDGSRQCAPLEPDDVIAALDAMAQEIENLRAELDGRAPVSPTDHWSPWLPWKGGPCPLPPVVIEIEGEPPYVSQASNWERPFRFRYVAKDPAGWLPRGEFIPPAELWAEGCPVRCEWTPQYIPSDADRPARWDHVTHIRLVAREAKAGLPEGWKIYDGILHNDVGPVLGKQDYLNHRPAAIRQAVDAWLREMGDE